MKYKIIGPIDIYTCEHCKDIIGKEYDDPTSAHTALESVMAKHDPDELPCRCHVILTGEPVMKTKRM